LDQQRCKWELASGGIGFDFPDDGVHDSPTDVLNSGVKIDVLPDRKLHGTLRCT
jgi:hypothetical protein